MCYNENSCILKAKLSLFVNVLLISHFSYRVVNNLMNYNDNKETCSFIN